MIGKIFKFVDDSINTVPEYIGTFVIILKEPCEEEVTYRYRVPYVRGTNQQYNHKIETRPLNCLEEVNE